MRQLSGEDASFLYSDSPHANGNITFIQVYDQRSAPGGKVRFKSILAHIEGRLHRSPLFRSKLARVPLELDFPYWIDDDQFDLEYHVRHIALPAPGDWRQFCIQASRIHARALDLQRPLWEIYVIEGLDSITDLPRGSFAVLTKIHHAAIDVERRQEIIEVLHDHEALAPRPEPVVPWFPAHAPSPTVLMCRGALNALTSPTRWLAPLQRMAPSALTFAGDVLRPENHPEAVRFNAVVTPHRVFDTRRFALEECRRIATLVPGSDVNDVVLAACAGGLARYLDRHGELPQVPLSAVAPLAVRDADTTPRTDGGPHWQRVDLLAQHQDPVARLRAIHEQTTSGEARVRAEAESRQLDLGRQLGAATQRLARRLLARVPGSGLHGQSFAACTLTNVPAPKGPVYLCGARMSYFSAILPIADGMGLVLAVTVHEGLVIVSPTSCRELMPDPQAFTQQVRDSFQELLALADAGAQPKAGKPAALRPGRPRASASARPSPPARKDRKASSGPRVATGARRRSTAPSG